MKTVLITGGSGFIGGHICRAAHNLKWRIIVLTRNPVQAAQNLPNYVNIIHNLKQLDSYPSIDILINLAGQSLAEGRWNAQRREQLLKSRIGTTEALYRYFNDDTVVVPKVVVSGSAVGFYGAGNGGDIPIAEDGEAEANFSQYLCAQWERSASQFEALGCRVCYLRTGIVLGEQGALAKMLPPFKMGLGGPFGKGEQWMSWIHIDDLVNIIIYCTEESALSGAVNGTAPEPVRNKDFVKVLATALGRPALLPMPAQLVKIIFGQMGKELLLQGKRVVPKKLQDSGYQFQYTDLQSAVSSLIH